MSTDITLEAYDDNGNQLFSYQVPFSWDVDVQQLLEQAYILNQTGTTPDPFFYTLEYYGYSQAAAYSGFLGYELESINSFQTGGNNYWSLSVNGNLSPTGIDTTFPNPGATVTLQYTSFTAAPEHASTQRARTIQNLRTQRAAARRAG